MTGYAAADAVGRNCRFLQGEATEQSAIETIRRGLATAEPFTVTILNYRADGTSFWNEVSISPVRDDAGELTHFVGVQRDVTDRVLSERARDLHHAREQVARADAEAAQARLAFLAEASAALDASLRTEGVVERLTKLAVPRVGDTCRVLVPGSRPDEEPDVEAILRRLGSMVESAGRPVLFTADGEEGSVAAPDELAVLRTGAVVAVPLVARGRHLGTMVVSRDDGTLPAEPELFVIAELTRRAAVALDNAHRFGERDHIARALQAALLPATLPVVPGAEVSTRYVPTGSGFDVGGDFYDVFATGSGWAVVIGDVCGKGPDAAAVTGLARHTVRAAAMHDAAPADVLAVLNHSLLEARLGDRFVTAAFASYRPDDDGATVRLALGGHPRPVLVGPGGARPVGQVGTLLGCLDEVVVTETELRVSPGEALVFVTDGVLEAPGPGGRLDEEDFLATVAAAAGGSAGAIADAVVDRVRGHTGDTPPDDIAVVVLRVRP